MTYSSSHSPDAVSATTRPSVVAGWLVSGLLIVFLAMDAGLKIAGLPIVAETVATLGWTPDTGFWRSMGLLLVGITALYAWPRTSVIGAILL
ncbi:MAG: DoxX family protein, partial [Bosea sp. (in: a-proteobacteria)]